jgi:hypothetical protein
MLLSMKRFLAITLFFSASAFADSFNGTLVDTMCSHKDDLAAHTTKCAVGCAKGGFGIMTSSGKFLKFDEAGNTKALAVLKSTKKHADLKATVTGTADGDTLKVDSVSLD